MGAAMAGQPGEATTDSAAGSAPVPGRGPGRPEETPPYISAWDWPAAKESVAALAGLSCLPVCG